MNQELENKVPVTEQVEELENVQEVEPAEYTLQPDGSVELTMSDPETA